MTFVNVGTLGALPGKRDELIALLTRPSTVLTAVGCLAYEVGTDDSEPDTVFVMELWQSAEAHRASLALPEVQSQIAEARPLLSGAFGGFRFDVVGSPLRT
ncbi:antibiotic biosynthesis monooxygenase [Microbacterium sp. ET2]|uniref:putative quinol monooxygenase n=1 Tax=Microbacterium albipurpureum TaxID=3050384 RepID=UPI00259CCBAC|nr:antibiotic biosynthesis monooxygenase [Microbacterium sp. ET2 (Ac-2212)]WJL96526.1 antibiotic biosynthesis monooxygenase [Microbacterium sp. ET2 (Ac-2212)]